MLTQGFQPVHLQPSCLNWDQATLPTHFKVTFFLNKLNRLHLNGVCDKGSSPESSHTVLFFLLSHPPWLKLKVEPLREHLLQVATTGCRPPPLLYA
jgi:hypothetical protein